MAGEQCCSNPPTLNPGAGIGHVEKFGGLHSYLTGSPQSNLAVLLISDVFGYEAPNLRNLADKIAADGYYVVVPDFFNGEPFDPQNTNRPFPEWIKDHGVGKGFEDAKPVVEALKSKGISAIGAVGFCWGAKVVVELAKPKLIQVAVLLHPSFVTVEDINAVDIPIGIRGAEKDQISPPEVIKKFEEVLSAKQQPEADVKVVPHVEHGWTVRYDTGDAEAVKAAGEAHQFVLEWFAKHLK
ncbi:hypothetical protein PIB30_004384 [Stylosanthes scabra]|uniref:Dienelactone hydrolase domain-containing protein n=1 Tax=Stylosanthes scabra TaxID=79078 RepID=A0ABU6U2I1_9FABA|nr:hypothetical protein [Stylosanthes scabra]